MSVVSEPLHCKSLNLFLLIMFRAAVHYFPNAPLQYLTQQLILSKSRVHYVTHNSAVCSALQFVMFDVAVHYFHHNSLFVQHDSCDPH
jgi:hypothetical protein